jgi:hypothetical protein
MSAGATVTGTRSWLASRHWDWLTPERLHRMTIAMVVIALMLSATVLSGSG